LVTGGSRGIGEATVKRFAEEGAIVVSGDIRKPTCDLPKGAEHVDLDVTIALMSPEQDAAKAQAYFERALVVARAQQAKSWELRSAISMARLWRD
jgi:NAD(P)-dependent dehydrogenase (short-subunit alcohol dehydrogenase family)